MVWFDDISSNDPHFNAIQMSALRGIYPMNAADLHASPEAPVTRAEAAVAIAAYFGQALDTKQAIDYVLRQGWMAADWRNWFHPDLPFYWSDWREGKMPGPLPAFNSVRSGPVRRWELATRLTSRLIRQQ